MRLTQVISTAIEKGKRIIKDNSNKATNSKQMNPWGFDSVPLKGSKAIKIKVGKYSIVIGCVQGASDIEKGESIMFSKNPRTGKLSSYIKCTNDDMAELLGKGDNLVRFNNLKEEFNELQNKFNAHVITYNAAMATIGAHTHQYSPGPLPPIPSSPPTGTGAASQASLANINNAKHESLETTSKPLI